LPPGRGVVDTIVGDDGLLISTTESVLDEKFVTYAYRPETDTQYATPPIYVEESIRGVNELVAVLSKFPITRSAVGALVFPWNVEVPTKRLPSEILDDVVPTIRRPAWSRVRRDAPVDDATANGFLVEVPCIKKVVVS
jgi:hypothetical protein